MVTLAEIEKLASELPVAERSELACRLLDSFDIPQTTNDDDGMTEAIRRSEEMDRDPRASVTHEELLKALGRES